MHILIYCSQLFENYGPPANVFSLGTQQFMRNLNAIRGEYEDEVDMSKFSHKRKPNRMTL